MSKVLITEECGPYQCRANDLATQRDAFKSDAKALRIELDQVKADLAAAREDVARMDWLEKTVKEWLYHADISIQSDNEDGVWVTRLYRERQGKQGLAFDSSEAKTETVRAAIDAARAATVRKGLKAKEANHA